MHGHFMVVDFYIFVSLNTLQNSIHCAQYHIFTSFV
jgi:hypothetical protein